MARCNTGRLIQILRIHLLCLYLICRIFTS